MKKEIYQEEESTFTHLGNEYDLNTILRLTHGRRSQKVRTYKLSWILAHGTADPERVAKADLSHPVICVLQDNTYFTIDGFHRLTKAVNEQRRMIDVVVINQKELETAKINKG